MCVDIDLNSDDEDADKEDIKLTVVEIVERELEKVKKEGPGAVVWLELEDLNIDDDVFVSLDLPTKFPVCHHCSHSHLFHAFLFLRIPPLMHQFYFLVLKFYRT